MSVIKSLIVRLLDFMCCLSVTESERTCRDLLESVRKGTDRFPVHSSDSTDLTAKALLDDSKFKFLEGKLI